MPRNCTISVQPHFLVIERVIYSNNCENDRALRVIIEHSGLCSVDNSMSFNQFELLGTKVDSPKMQYICLPHFKHMLYV